MLGYIIGRKLMRGRRRTVYGPDGERLPRPGIFRSSQQRAEWAARTAERHTKPRIIIWGQWLAGAAVLIMFCLGYRVLPILIILSFIGYYALRWYRRQLAEQAALEQEEQERFTRTLFLALAPSLTRTDPELLDHTKWVGFSAVPLDSPRGWIAVSIPPGWQGTDQQTATLTRIINQRVPGEWELERLDFERLVATWIHPPKLPDRVDFEDDGGPIEKDPAGVRRSGARIVIFYIDFEQETPNVLVSASPGFGKTTFIALRVARFVSRGGRALIIDGKIVSYTDAPEESKRPFNERGFRNVPGIVIETELVSQMEAIRAFRIEMDRRYNLAKTGVDITDKSRFPDLMLAIDEISRFMMEVRRWWAEQKQKGTPPTIDDIKAIEFQGRQSRCYLVVGAHNPNANALGGSDSRQMFASRFALGPQDAGSWRMLFGNRPMPKGITFKKKGSAYWGGMDPVRVQLTYANLHTSRELALSGPLAQAGAELPETVTLDGVTMPGLYAPDPPEVTQRRHTYRPTHTTPTTPPAAPDAPSVPVSVPPAGQGGNQGETAVDVPGDILGDGHGFELSERPTLGPRPPAGPIRYHQYRPGGSAPSTPEAPAPAPQLADPAPAPFAFPFQQRGNPISPMPHPDPAPAPQPETSGEKRYTIAEAAEFLGMKPDSFNKARRRAEQRGDALEPQYETIDGTVRATFGAKQLRDWNSRRPIAGRRKHDQGASTPDDATDQE